MLNHVFHPHPVNGGIAGRIIAGQPAARSEIDTPTIRTEVVAAAQGRIASGYYEQNAVIDETARKFLDSFADTQIESVRSVHREEARASAQDYRDSRTKLDCEE